MMNVLKMKKNLFLTATVALLISAVAFGQSKNVVSIPDSLLIVPGERVGISHLCYNINFNATYINTEKYRTSEGLGLGSTLQDVLKVYPNCILDMGGTYVYISVDEMLKSFLSGSEDYRDVGLVCYDKDENPLGIQFDLTLKRADTPNKIKQESIVYLVWIYDPSSTYGNRPFHLFEEGGYDWINTSPFLPGTVPLHQMKEGIYKEPPALQPVRIGEFVRIYKRGEQTRSDTYKFVPDPNGYYYHFEEFVTDGDGAWDAYWRYEEQFTATSTLAPSGTTRYDANNLRNDKSREVGGNRSVALCEGVKGYGIGERIHMRIRTLTQSERQTWFTELMIVNGYAKNETTWKNNTRVKILRMYVNNKHWCDLHLADVINPQVFTFPTGLRIYPTISGKKIAPEGKFVKPADAYWPESPVVYQTDLSFEIIEVYPGDKYDDTCITGIALDSAGGIY